MFSEGVVYNCFNCKFTASWQPGRTLSEKFKNLCRWLGASDDEINSLIFESLKTESTDYKPEISQPAIKFVDKPLPEGAMPLLDWVNSKYFKDIETELEPIISYVVNRGYDPFDGNFYWTPAAGYVNRVILPYFYQGRIVGNTARRVDNGKPKYLSDQPPFFVYNIDNQIEENKYIFVVEGQFDALSVGGVGLLTNEVSDQQARIINNIGKEVIVIPDQDKAGSILIDQAKELGWSIAFPTWESDIKDCAEAVAKYGKLFVIVDAIATSTTNPAKIEIEKRKLLAKLEIENV